MNPSDLRLRTEWPSFRSNPKVKIVCGVGNMATYLGLYTRLDIRHQSKSVVIHFAKIDQMMRGLPLYRLETWHFHRWAKLHKLCKSNSQNCTYLETHSSTLKPELSFEICKQVKLIWLRNTYCSSFVSNSLWILLPNFLGCFVFTGLCFFLLRKHPHLKNEVFSCWIDFPEVPVAFSIEFPVHRW